MSQVQHRVVETNGIHLRIAEQGSGPLVILRHGLPESWYSCCPARDGGAGGIPKDGPRTNRTRGGTYPFPSGPHPIRIGARSGGSAPS